LPRDRPAWRSTAARLPPELQNYVVFIGGVAAGANEPTAAKALIDFLTSPASAAAIRSKGIEPQGAN
jgi:molybdate transport system substrate-binding protein